MASLGAIVLSTGSTTYDRLVVSRASRPGNDTAEPAYVPTRDNLQCALFVCAVPALPTNVSGWKYLLSDVRLSRAALQLRSFAFSVERPTPCDWTPEANT